MTNRRQARRWSALVGCAAILLCSVSLTGISAARAAPLLSRPASDPSPSSTPPNPNPTALPNPTLLSTGSTGAPTFTTNQPPYGQAGTPPQQEQPPVNTIPGPYPTPIAGGASANSSIAAHSKRVDRKSSEQSLDHARPRVIQLSQYTSDASGYGVEAGPTDNTIASDGTVNGTTYNGSAVGENASMVILFSSSSGTPLKSYGLCGVSGYPYCSDPEINYDRDTGNWIETYEVWNQSGNTVTQEELIVCASKDSQYADGFSCWALGSTTSGSFDAPRIGYTTDKVILTVNFYSSTCPGVDVECDLIFVLNKTQLYSLDGFHFTESQGVGYNYYVTSTPSYEQTILFESPDAYTTNAGTMVTHYITGPENSYSWATVGWTIATISQEPLFASQPGTSIPLYADGSEVESSALSGGLAWATLNDEPESTGCPGPQLCPFFIQFTVNGNVLPTGIDHYFAYSNPNGWSMYYTALATTIGNTSVIGVSDYSCNGTCAEYAGSEEYEVTPTAGFTFAGRQDGTTTMQPSNETIPDPPGPSVPVYTWGDINGCSYVNGTSPAQVVCAAAFAAGSASSPVPQQEVFLDEYS